MVPFNNPIPQSPAKSKASSGLFALVEAEKLMQIALLVPSSVCICWLIGAGLDLWLHQKWISIAGIIFGSISGLTYVVRMALAAEKNSRPTGNDTNTADGSK
jgi:hypothetical protein